MSYLQMVRRLDDRLLSAQPSAFPRAADYAGKYRALSDYLNREVHKYVVAGAISVDGGFLNDHGPDHISKLIDRLSKLVPNDGQISFYETFLLLVAAQFHDVGNIFGRSEHEKRSREVMDRIRPMISEDAVELKWIHRIAEAHGGKPANKVEALPINEPIFGEKVRPRFLAALLKFGDEIAEDSDRAARFLLEGGHLPQQAEIFHAYAAALHSVSIEHDASEIQLVFHLTEEVALKVFSKPTSSGPGERYLLDEILERTLKTHRERVFCMRYLRPTISLDRISVRIVVTSRNGYDDLCQIAYRIEEIGYPESSQSIYELCPELQCWNGNGQLTGEALAKRIGS